MNFLHVRILTVKIIDGFQLRKPYQTHLTKAHAEIFDKVWIKHVLFHYSMIRINTKKPLYAVSVSLFATNWLNQQNVNQFQEQIPQVFLQWVFIQLVLPHHLLASFLHQYTSLGVSSHLQNLQVFLQFLAMK